MPAWIAITPADIEARVPSVVLSTLRERYVDASADPLVSITADVTALVRGRISSNKAFALDQDETLIPPELKDDACWLIVEALKLRMPDAAPISDREANRIADARKQLEAVAQGHIVVSIPANPQASPSAQSDARIAVVSGSPRRVGRQIIRGLM